MTRRENDLGNDSMGKLVLRMSLPTVTAQMVNALYNIVDRIYIGHMAGESSLALAGIGVTHPLIVIITACINLIGVGGSTRASVSMGAGDNKTAEKIMGTCAFMQTVMAVIFTIGLQMFKRPLLWGMGASAETISYAETYLTIYLCGTLFAMLSLGMNLFISAQGFSKVSMGTILIGGIINIALDPIFIFTFRMGVAGAALATVISQMISAIWVLRFLCGKRSYLKLRRETFRFNGKLLKPVVGIGLSPFTMQSTEALLNFAFNSSLRRYGGDIVVGAFTIASSAIQTMVILLGGYTQGIQPIISFNYGARNRKRVKQAAVYSLSGCILLGLISWGIMEFAPHLVVNLFSKEDELRECAVWVMKLYSWGFFLLGIQHSCQYILLALGKTKINLLLACYRKLILLIPMIYILPHFMENKVFAVLVSEPIADITAAITTGIVFIISFKKLMQDKTLWFDAE